MLYTTAKRLFRICLAAIICILTANLTVTASTGSKTLLIINSYHEDELWGNGMIEPIITHLARNIDIDCELVYLNNSIVSDSAVYKTISNNVFERFADNHPDYLVLLGNFAFNLRDRIKSEWGDIPMLLISRTRGFGNLEDYFATLDPNVSVENQTPLESVRSEYNFTAMFVPDYCTQTVDMMTGLIPDMDEFIFLADVSYVNRIAAFRLSNYLTDKYPKIKFKWLMASQSNAEEFRRLMINRDPRLGLLLSSWTYETMSTRGYPILTSKDLTLITTSENPVFTLRQAYLSYGTIGGVFTDNQALKDEAVKIVDEMIAGKSMRDIPFYEPDAQLPTINYTKLEKYGLKEANCPKGTHLIQKPQSYWEKYGLWTVIIVVLALVALSLLLKKNNEQRNKIDILNRHSHFINNMPVPYTCAHIKFDDKGNLKDITLYDRNQAFIDMLNDNTVNVDANHIKPSELFVAKLQELIDKKQTVTFTYHFETTDKYFDMLICPVQMPQATGKKVMVIDVFARDITNRQKMQMDLRNTASKLDMTISIAKLIPWQMDWKTRRLEFDTSHEYVSDALKKYESKTLTLDDYIKRIHPEDVKLIQDVFDDIQKGKIKEYMIQYRVLQDDDPDKIDWAENHGAVTQYNDDGTPKTITGSIQIITQEKEKEEQMRVALIKANESDRLKSSFLANMSHEIRTPLNAIVGFSSMMVRTKTEKERQDLSNVINKNNDLLLNLINDVLDLAKIESNTIELVNNICDVDDLMESVCKTMSIRVPKGVKLNIVHYTENCRIEVDSSRLTQLLINLLTNACKFTSKGNITVGYEIREDNNELYFFVKDTGIGIAKDKQATIFDQFVKLNAFAQGTGLGLAICQSLVERMGGKIGVKSEGEGKGSMFWFTLPYNPVEIEDVILETENDESDDAKKTDQIHDFLMPEDSEEVDQSKRKKVLIAEDNQSNYQLLQQMLRHRYNLVWAQNGKEAVEMCKAEDPDIIIMDINMPEMDGYEAVAEIRKFSEDVPIIAVTAYAFASDRLRILNSGFNAYVSKPISEIALFEAMHHVMTGRNEMP